MIFKNSLFIAACSFAMASTVSAQDSTTTPYSPKEQMAIAVMKHVAENNLEGLIEGDFEEAQLLLRLSLLAKQFAIAETCDGFELDNDRYVSVLNDTISPFSGLVEEGQNNLVTDRVMFGYGTLLGGELALASFDPDAFCAFGAQMRDEFGENDAEGKILVLAPAQ